MHVRDVLFTLFLCGCSFHASCNGNGLDMAKAKTFVSGFAEQYTGVKPTSVDCPDHVKAEKDGVFACTVAYDGASGVVSMRQTTTSGDVTVVSMTGIIASAKVESLIAGSLEKQPGGPFTVDCGARVHPSKPGDTLTCDVRGPAGVVAHALVKIKNEDNDIEYDVTAAEAPPPAP